MASNAMNGNRAKTVPPNSQVREGELLWMPDSSQIANSNIDKFTRWLAKERGLSFADYESLWRWSVTEVEGFWQAIWEYFGVESSAPHRQVLAKRTMPGAEWFPGARLNYAQHVLRHEKPGAEALLFASETKPLAGLGWETFAGQVRILATEFRSLGVRPGDRVGAYMPNIPQTMVAMLATTAIGAVWCCCSPDFGVQGAIDRLQQLSPKILLFVDGYVYGGKSFDRTSEAVRIIDAMPHLQRAIFVSNLPAPVAPPFGDALPWDELMDQPAIAAGNFEFEQVPFDHPLWVLFSSGTTGLPKAIVHGHGGIIVEQLKLQHFHMDFHPGEKTFFFTTSGWMMWNLLASMPISGACPVLYDGNPAYPSPDILWRIAEASQASFFGASPSYVDLMIKAGVVPGEQFDLSHLRAVMPAGSPVSPECTEWFYRNVKNNLWVATGSGGTDCCTGFVGGVPTLPVYAGEIQARSLGVAVFAFNDRGESVIDEVGEMVITEPLPSMPLYFWNDTDGSRLRESYFEQIPGRWRHGDFFRVNQRGGCVVHGRSDATLNRQGIRIGTAEIYRALSGIPEIDSALVVNLDLPEGKFFMPLFVKLRNGSVLDSALVAEINRRLKRQYSPRHVPDRIIQAPDIPVTLTGKKLEVAVRKILMGMPLDQAANRNAMSNPDSLEFFLQHARTQSDYSLLPTTILSGAVAAPKPEDFHER
jgi:acetoacetyl-CoA synthetase